MNRLWQMLKCLHLSRLWYLLAFVLTGLFVAAYFYWFLFDVASAGLAIFAAACTVDVYLLFRNPQAAGARRSLRYQRLSNGDNNEVTIAVNNGCSFPLKLRVIDELPVQLQLRDFILVTHLAAGESRQFRYTVRPLQRGEYHFGNINLFFSSPLGLAERRITVDASLSVPCYPSFLRLRQYQILAVGNRLSELSQRKVRRIGHSMEFEQVEEYTRGNDIRKLNWKASARKNKLMVNHYTDERAQTIYCVIDMGRAMKMPFDGLTLLDYAINASLVLGHVAWIRQDKPGLIGFAEKVMFTVPASRKGNQLLQFQEALYHAATNFEEPAFDKLLHHMQLVQRQRSLLLMFTNFESLSALKRQLRYLKKLASGHLLVLIFFENTELTALLSKEATQTLDVYEQAIAGKFELEKRQIAVELQRHGIITLYTPPSELTINTLNKYLEVKTRGML